MENLNTHIERMQWRRAKVMELSSQGNNQTAISKILQVGIGTVNRDLSILRQQSRASIQQYNERLPHEYDKCMIALTEILKQSFDISHEPDIERREKIQVLSLIKEVISAKLDLLTNCTVVDDVVKFIENYKNKFGSTRSAETPLTLKQNHKSFLCSETSDIKEVEEVAKSEAVVVDALAQEHQEITDREEVF